MIDKKLPDAEIVKALEYCIKDDCKNCPLGNIEDCVTMIDALDLINRQKAEIERLKAQCENTQVGYNFLKADFEELKADKIIAERKEKDARDLFKSTVGQLKQSKAEAYKEFAERLCEGRVSNDNTVILAKCLLKELVGDNQ